MPALSCILPLPWGLAAVWGRAWCRYSTLSILLGMRAGKSLPTWDFLWFYDSKLGTRPLHPNILLQQVPIPLTGLAEGTLGDTGPGADSSLEPSRIWAGERSSAYPWKSCPRWLFLVTQGRSVEIKERLTVVTVPSWTCSPHGCAFTFCF